MCGNVILPLFCLCRVAHLLSSNPTNCSILGSIWPTSLKVCRKGLRSRLKFCWVGFFSLSLCCAHSFVCSYSLSLLLFFPTTDEIAGFTSLLEGGREGRASKKGHTLQTQKTTACCTHTHVEKDTVTTKRKSFDDGNRSSSNNNTAASASERPPASNNVRAAATAGGAAKSANTGQIVGCSLEKVSVYRRDQIRSEWGESPPPLRLPPNRG